MKNKFVRGLCIALAVIVIFGVAGAVVTFAKNDSKNAGVIFTRGGLDENGEYVKTNKSIYTEKAFECDGLRVEPDFESTVSYDIYFYDDNKNLVDKKLGLKKVYDADFDLAKYARIVIHPEIPEGVKEKDFEIGFFDIADYASMLNIKVDKNQVNYATENLIIEDDFHIGYYFGNVAAERDTNNLVQDESGRIVTNNIYVEEGIESYDIWVYISREAVMNTTFCLFDNEGKQIFVDGKEISVGCTNVEVTDRPRWVCLTLEIPELDSYEGVHIAGCISGDTTGVYVYGNN